MRITDECAHRVFAHGEAGLDPNVVLVDFASDLLDARRELEDRDTVPRSRYNACNNDWLEAKARLETVTTAAEQRIAELEREMERCAQELDYEAKHLRTKAARAAGEDGK
jgi:multidrug resistance efflux pump